MTTKPPSGTGLAADDADSIEDILSAVTPMPLNPSTKTPGPVIKTPAPTLKTPGPVAATNRDPSSALPSIPPPTKEPSGAFPLPGMAPPDGSNGAGSDDVTLIARLSVLDDLVEESTKVEPLEAALRAKASTDEGPIDLVGQAAAQRDKALSMAAPTALDRISAAEFEDPGDDDDDAFTVSATPGIISIEEDDDDEPTASQRPPGLPRTTPAPLNLGGPSLGGRATPAPLPAGTGPRLPAPTPVPGRALHLPTPNGGMPLFGGGSGPTRTPALPIPAPIGGPAMGGSAPLGIPAQVAPARSAVFKSVQVPLGGIVACLVAVFGAGFVVGAYLWQGDAPPPVAAEAPARPATELPQRTQPASEPAVAAQPAQAAAAPAENAASAQQPAEKPAVVADPVQPKPVPAAAEKPAEETTKLVAHVPPAPAKARPVRKPAAKPVASAAPAAEKPAAEKPAPVETKPAAAKPKSAPVASTKPSKPEKGRGKGWVDPFAE